MVEMLAVVAMIGVLAAIALPSYQESIRKSRRSQVKADLQEIQQNLERYFTLNNTYVGFNLGTFNKSPRSAPSNKQAYNIAFDGAVTATTFALTAAPANAQAGDRCGTFRIDQAGRKTPTTPDDCW